MGLDYVSKLDSMLKMAQFFVDDLVHRTKESSENYVNVLLLDTESLFTAEVVDLEEDTTKKPKIRGTKSRQIQTKISR